MKKILRPSSLLISLCALFLTCKTVNGQVPAPTPRNQILLGYQVTETIVKDQCYPERKALTRTYPAYLVQINDKFYLYHPKASELNPVEHSFIQVTHLISKNKSPQIIAEGKTSDYQKLQFGKNGTLHSKLTISLRFDQQSLEGDFSNRLRFDAGELGLIPVQLWLESHKALQKIKNHSVDSLPAIAKPTPCTISGSIRGERLATFEQFSPMQEFDFLQLIQRSEELFGGTEVKASMEVLEKAVVVAPERPDAYWRLSRGYFILAEHLDPEDREGRLAMLEKSKFYAKTALKKNRKHPESWFFLTAALGRHATTTGLLKTIRVTGRLEKGFQKTMKNRPTYNFSGFNTAGDTHCGLGIYYRLVPDWWIVKVITGSRGNLDRAVYHLREALRYQPYRIEYNKELGIALLCRGLKKNRVADIIQGKLILRKTLKLPNLLQTDPLDKRHIEELLADHKKACAYSRDGYEDLSKEALTYDDGDIF